MSTHPRRRLRWTAVPVGILLVLAVSPSFSPSIVRAQGTPAALERPPAESPQQAGGGSKTEEGQVARAALSYRELVAIAQRDARQGGVQEDKPLHFLISSNRGVPVGELRLVLREQTGETPVPINAEGRFQLSYRAAWLEANPMLISNQPRGTLSLSFLVELPKMDELPRPKVVDGKVAYRDLFQPLLRLRDEMRRVDPEFAREGKETLALEIEGTGEGITIEREFGSRMLKPDQRGKIWLLHDEALQRENPLLKIPAGAEIRVRPVSPEAAAAIRKR